MENIIDISNSIKAHINDEYKRGLSNRAIARICAEKNSSVSIYFLTNNEDRSISFNRDFVGNVNGTISTPTTSKEGGQPVYKNTKLGRALIGDLGVNATYSAPRGIISVKPINRTVYSPSRESATEIQISLDSKHQYQYSSLEELLNFISTESNKIQEQQEQIEKLKKEQDRLRKQEEDAKEAERIRLEKEQIQKEQEYRQKEIKRINQRIAEAEENFKHTQELLHKNVMLRSQHILDAHQEDAKRSHIYDGVPIVIEGGPGTGKTTTVIQRLKFLLSKQSLEDYNAPLTPEQIERFADSSKSSQQWLFFSPTDLLLQYLRNNMQGEGLQANDKNTRTIERFRKVMLLEYGIISPTSQKFKEWKDSRSPLILDEKKVISLFENFCIKQIKDKRDRLISFDVSNFVWSEEAKSIQKICTQVDILDKVSMTNLLETLYSMRETYTKTVEDILRDDLNDKAMAIKQSVMEKEDIVKSLEILLNEEKIISNTIEDDDSEDEISNEESTSNAEIDFDTKLYTNIRTLIRKIGLQMVDQSTRIRGKQQKLLEIIEDFIDRKVPQTDLKNIGEYVFFSKNFTPFCQGVENLFINKIPQMYKLFRKTLTTEANSPYDINLLRKIINKENNKHLHADEQNLLLGFINENLIYFSKKYNTRFNKLKGKFSTSYKNYNRPILGIDEATDYTIMDYYCMISFRHNEFATITLSGDLMQGMHHHGINKWTDLKELFPNLEVFSLNICYRQTPTLIKMARELYKDSLGEYPNYDSNKEKTDSEAKPILLISDNQTAKIEWICQRIINIFNKYGTLPSVAIFIGDSVNPKEFINTIEESDLLNGIEVVDCTDGKSLDSQEVVRIFRLSKIKGMEFEVAFFYDIDTAIQGTSNDLMRRNLYVGVSRAASHLAATMTQKNGNEAIIKYFETNNTEW